MGGGVSDLGQDRDISLDLPNLASTPCFIDSPVFQGCLGLSLRRLSQEVYRTGRAQVGNSGGRPVSLPQESQYPGGITHSS